MRGMWRGILAGALCLVLLLSAARAEQVPSGLEQFREMRAQTNYQRLAVAGHALRVALAAWNTTRESVALPDPRGSSPDSPMIQGVERREDVSPGLKGAASAIETGPGVPWFASAAAVPLLVIGVVLGGRRSVPSLRLGGALFTVTAARSLPPPLLRPLLRLASMGLLAAAILVPVLFQPLLLASTGLLLGSVAFASGGG